MAEGNALKELDALRAKKTELEDEIASITKELTSGPMAVGIKGPLVDSEGFPRADIDIYTVRHQRHRLATLQTDHLSTMRRIETLLPILLHPQTPNTFSEKPANTSRALPKTRAKPFASIQSVEQKSPAASAGLEPNDLIVRFGSADASNHRNLAAIRDIVSHHLNQPIAIEILRHSNTETESLKLIHLELIPQRWSGNGTLGCQFAASSNSHILSVGN
ncbi:unnamed protein product [Albugo candida]|uniref:Nas2 N-terminal domain-containing protein n=1 Tax=Albugo candida TaxID=65357 RepID=A0A024G3E9_9STRA|nr:unnamed protein product [Albugo candida]|eukprot:CCI41363.1 unnamed protein product [Albugo candida]